MVHIIFVEKQLFVFTLCCHEVMPMRVKCEQDHQGLELDTMGCELELLCWEFHVAC